MSSLDAHLRLLGLLHLDALASPAVVGVLAWGLAAGCVVAWLAHRYHGVVDDEGYEVATLGVASCRECGHELAPRDVLPLQVFRCPHCRLRLPATWAVAQASVVVASLAMLAALGTRPALVPFLWLAPVLVLAAIVDARTFLIPKRVVWIGAGVGLVLISVVSVVRHHPELIAHAVIGSIGYFLVLFIANLINPAGMGFGDVRLAIVLGLYLGWLDLRLPIWGLLLGCVLGLVFALARRLTAVTEEDKAFPFGPGLAMGTIAAVFLAQFVSH